MATRKRKPITSMAQAAQRELSWLLFISEGYRANIECALTVNAYTLDDSVLALMNKQLENAEQACDRLRKKLQQLSKC